MQGFIPAPAIIPHPMPHPFIHPAPPVEPPAAKKPKSDIDNLIPENQFIASHPVSLLSLNLVYLYTLNFVLTKVL